MAWARAVYDLEQARRLRCVRLANYKDVVTLLPDHGTWSCLYITACQGLVYRHVGWEIKCYLGSGIAAAAAAAARGGGGGGTITCQITRSNRHADASYGTVWRYDWYKQLRNCALLVITLPLLMCAGCCHEDFLRYHSCKEYMERLWVNAEYLQSKQLNDLYDEADRHAALRQLE